MRRRWSDRSSRRVRTLVTQLARSRLVRESGRMRADTHDGPELTLQSEAGYSNARPHQPGRRNLLHRTAGPYSWVITGKAQREHKISALPLKADTRQMRREGGLVPQAAVSNRSEAAPYSLTSAATSSRSRGISRSSDLAVFRLMTSSYLVGCSIGRSAGFVPFRILAT